jgi:TPR repeat protein
LKEDAQYNLGVMYEKGLGVKQDDDQAAYWYDKAKTQKP